MEYSHSMFKQNSQVFLALLKPYTHKNNAKTNNIYTNKYMYLW